MTEHRDSTPAAGRQPEPVHPPIGALVPLREARLGDGLTQTVSARDLHAFLEVGKDFSSWIKDRIGAYGFAEGLDYLVVEDLSSPDLVSAKARPQRIKEYFLTIDMAKELSMVERNAKGKEARRYFIACEKRLQTGVGAMTLSADARQVFGGIAKAVVGKALEDHLAPLERQVSVLLHRLDGLNNDPAVQATVEFRPMLTILKDMAVPAKGRRGLSTRCSKAMMRWAISSGRGADVRVSRETGRYLFQVDAINEWMTHEGRAVISDWRATQAGQSVMAFRPRKGPKSGGAA
jgi:phage anti-repressor protein